MANDIPAHRLEGFARSVAKRVNEMSNKQEIYATIATEQWALEKILRQPDIAAIAAQSLLEALNAKLPAAHHIPEAMARQSVEGILANRAADAKAFAAMMATDAMHKLVEGIALSPVVKEGALPPAKQQELIDRLVQAHDVRGAEPPVHVLASAVGHRIMHEALSEIFAEKAALALSLQQQLQLALPSYTEDACAKIAQGWVAARRTAAVAVTESMTPQSDVMQRAMDNADVLLKQKHTAPAAETRTAAEIERSKTPLQKGQDVAYTINHSIMCLSSDWIDPIVGGWTQRKLGNNISLGGLADFLTKGKVSAAENNNAAGNKLAWWIGEAIGDVGAVPVTILMQRIFPGFMQGIQRGLEPPLSGLFRRASHKQAVAWGVEQGLDATDPKIKQKENELYKYEVDHLPQAFMWTASSIAMNLTAQKLWFNKDASLPVLLIGKGLGTAITAATLVSARGFFPKQMHGADTWVSKYIITPVAQSIGSVFGIDHRTMKTPMQADLSEQLKTHGNSRAVG
jgi:hypothetical protein